jgi:hypothetical protein
MFAGREFKRQHYPAAAFARAVTIFFIGHKEFQGSQKKGPKPPLLRVGAIEIPAFQHTDKEILREILRLAGRIPAPAQVGIQRIPVALTQSSQSRPRFLSTWIAGSDHHSPPRRWKPG